MTTTFKVGDVVCYAHHFLRDTCWYTGVPINGEVTDVQGDFVTVQWNDREGKRIVHKSNLILYSERHLEPF